MAKDSPYHPINLIDWGTRATENLKDLASEFKSIKRGGGRDVHPFLFFLFFFGYLRQRGSEGSSVGLGLTWVTRCSCLPRRDSYAMDTGLLFVNTGKELILIYEPFFGKWIGFAAYDTNMPI